MRLLPALVGITTLVLLAACGRESPLTAVTGSGDIVTETGDDEVGWHASLSHECVRAGEEQVLTVTGPPRGIGFKFDSTYSNGRSGQREPIGGGYGGHGVGLVAETGFDRARWELPADAPSGLVEVEVALLLPPDLVPPEMAIGVSPDTRLTRGNLAFHLAGSGEECW